MPDEKKPADDLSTTQLVKLEGIVDNLKAKGEETAGSVKQLAEAHQKLEVNHEKGMTTVAKGFEYVGEKIETLITRHDHAEKTRTHEIEKLTESIGTLANSITKIGELERSQDALKDKLDDTRARHFDEVKALNAELNEVKKNLELEEERRKNADVTLKDAIDDKHILVKEDIEKRDGAVTKAIEKHEQNNQDEFRKINDTLMALNKLRWAIYAIPVLLAAVIAILTIYAYLKGIAVVKP